MQALRRVFLSAKQSLQNFNVYSFSPGATRRFSTTGSRSALEMETVDTSKRLARLKLMKERNLDVYSMA
jgi:hypothetical protein